MSRERDGVWCLRSSLQFLELRISIHMAGYKLHESHAFTYTVSCIGLHEGLLSLGQGNSKFIPLLTNLF